MSHGTWNRRWQKLVPARHLQSWRKHQEINRNLRHDQRLCSTKFGVNRSTRSAWRARTEYGQTDKAINILTCWATAECYINTCGSRPCNISVQWKNKFHKQYFLWKLTFRDLARHRIKDLIIVIYVRSIEKVRV